MDCKLYISRVVPGHCQQLTKGSSSALWGASCNNPPTTCGLVRHHHPYFQKWVLAPLVELVLSFPPVMLSFVAGKLGSIPGPAIRDRESQGNCINGPSHFIQQDYQPCHQENPSLLSRNYPSPYFSEHIPFCLCLFPSSNTPRGLMTLRMCVTL